MATFINQSIKMYTSILLFYFVTAAHGAPNFVSYSDERIVGGIPTTIEQHPYQLSLQFHGSHICGASIISNRYALTAAHCTYDSLATDLSIRAGSTTHTKGGITINVLTIIQNMYYNPRTIDYDISILELAKVIKFDETMQAIRLPIRSPTEKEVALCTGWGLLAEGGPRPSKLQVVSLPIVSSTYCNATYSGAITDRMICAGYTKGGKDACQGDSGGPLVLNGTQVGIVSWGKGCALPTIPGVYTNVYSLSDFIKSSLS